MRFLLHMGIGIAILLIALLVFKKERKLADFYLIAWIGIFFCQLLFYEFSLYQRGLNSFWAILGFSFPLLNMPLLYGYIRALIGRPLNPKELLSHVSPFLLYFFIFLGTKYLLDIEVQTAKGYLILEGPVPSWLQLYPIPLAILGFVYCIWNLILLRQHKKNLPQIFSYSESINLNWIRYLIYGYLLFTLFGLVLIFGATNFGLFDIDSVFGILAAVIGLMVAATGFWGLQQTDIFSTVPTPSIPNIQAEAEPYQKSGLAPERAQRLAEQLRTFMEEEHLYLNEELTLPLLAEAVNLSPAHLSQVINQQFGKNFFDFVNAYRVEEAKKRLRNPEFSHFSILAIGLDCGFRSKSSFNRAFKKFVGSTPSEYRKMEG
ncbi:MAG: helix-turn-helix domain-containing protein [Bacteroidota bacterium]